MITETAIEAYRKMERASLSLERAEYNLGVILASHQVDMAEYVRQTEKIRTDYEEKRRRLSLRDRLPFSRRLRYNRRVR